MTPKTLIVWRVTLAPTSSTAQDECSTAEVEGTLAKDDAANILNREPMERAVAITTATGAYRWRLDSSHGVEPSSGLRF
jgi:hypothetical protein